MEIWGILRDIVVLLSAALLAGGLVSRLGHSPLIGYLIAGMLLGGPGSLGLVESPHEIEAIAELGVALLLFSLGLEFSVERLKKLGLRPLLGGVWQVVLTLAVGCLVAWPLGLDFKSALAFGAMISLSSTAVVLRMLMERSELEMPHGRNCLAVLLTQDMAVVPLALLVSVLGGKGGVGEIAKQTSILLAASLGLIVGLMLLNRLAVMALGTLTLQRNRELTVVFAVVSGLGAAWSAQAVGVSPALGAFIAGMLLGSSPFATQVRADISSLRVLLLTLFFSAAGMVADPLWTLQNWYLVAATTLALTLGKLIIVWVVFLWLGQSHRVAAATGFCLAQIGEFAFVLGAIGKANGVVTESLYSLVISTAITSFLVSALMVPAAVRFGNWVARWFCRTPGPEETVAEPHKNPDIVIIGYGPAGQAALEPLLDQSLQLLAIDLNHEGVRKAQEHGIVGQIGDAMQLDVLEHAHVPNAKAIVITVPHFRSALTILDNVRQLAPHAFVLVRSRYKLHTDDFAAKGVIVVGDEEQVGQELAGQLVHWIEKNPIRKPSESEPSIETTTPSTQLS